MMNRRWFTAALALSATRTRTFAAEPPIDPILWLCQRGSVRVYIMGYATAYDSSWLTPKIERALNEMTELWLETPPGTTGAAQTGQGSQEKPSTVFEERGYDRSGNLFDKLPPDLSRRTLAWATRLGLDPKILEPMRPWLAKTALQQTQAAAHQKTAPPTQRVVSAENVVIAKARERGVPIRSESASLDDLLRFFANLPDDAQVEYLAEQVDYMDEHDSASANPTDTSWISGRPDSRVIDEMGTRYPALYKAEHVDRNHAWAERIDGMLDSPGVHFVMIGNNHVLGPFSIPESLRRINVPIQKI
ncbi:MAG: TraB/GumN family protein [Pseudomonadota bacterium]